jgi:peptidoglycan/LPS O-acetylase OafA/YrhL
MRQHSRLSDIDGLRAVAVLAVLFHHSMVWGVRPSAAPFWLTYGARGVDLFFVVSGFCLAYPILASRYERGAASIDYGTFVSRRLVRIAPPYLAALTLFAALSLTPFGLPTTHSVRFALWDGLKAYLLDASFLTSFFPAYNESFWTIGLEMRWYLLFPFVLALFMRSRMAVLGVMLACYALTLATDVSIETLRTLPCFVLGIFAADLRLRGKPTAWANIALCLTLPLAILRQTNNPNTDHGDIVWHVACFCLVVASAEGPLARILSWAPLRLVGIASFSIYLVHEPIEWSLESAGMPALLSAGISLLSGFLFFAFVERRFLAPSFRVGAERLVERAWTFFFRKPLILSSTVGREGSSLHLVAMQARDPNVHAEIAEHDRDEAEYRHPGGAESTPRVARV